ncbi:MAG: hypothetical protein QHJ81_14415, partial [Anaerolineae bacterium]|nr:hypothetical protein [Anaerolineae bacterium]
AAPAAPPPEAAPPAEAAPAAPPPEAERPSPAAILLRGTEYEDLELTAGALDLLERLMMLQPGPQASEVSDRFLRQLKEAQEFRKEALLFSSLAEAKAVLDEDRAFVGKTYVLQAGVARQEMGKRAEKPPELPFREALEPVLFDILVHGGANIELPEWQKRLRYEPLNLEPQRVDFAFRPTAAGHCSLAVDFYHGQRWLRTIRLEFDAIEAPGSGSSA